jgi:hypothetical protein
MAPDFQSKILFQAFFLQGGWHSRLKSEARGTTASTKFPQQFVHKGVFFNLSALLITDTLLNAMAALAMMGLSRTPKNG